MTAAIIIVACLVLGAFLSWNYLGITQEAKLTNRAYGEKWEPRYEGDTQAIIQGLKRDLDEQKRLAFEWGGQAVTFKLERDKAREELAALKAKQ